MSDSRPILASDAQRIDAFDALVDTFRSLHRDCRPGEPLDEERLTKVCHELIFEGSRADVEGFIRVARAMLQESK